jgi:hypothetical protein
MHMHINRRRKDEKSGAVYRPVCRQSCAGMADMTVRYRDVCGTPTRNRNIPQDKGRQGIHSIHFSQKGIKAWSALHRRYRSEGLM